MVIDLIGRCFKTENSFVVKKEKNCGNRHRILNEELTFSVDSRFTSISLHASKPLHFLRSGSHGFSPPLPLKTHTRLPGQHQLGER